MTYDFSNLSADDFEGLIRDLLRAEHGRRFESFAPGRDGGVDIRSLASISAPADGYWMAQCKHYLGSTYQQLLAAAKKDAIKAAKLPQTPSRYFFATSKRLSLSNKSELKRVFEPLMLRDDDVWGGDDIEALLGAHPDVERRHIKLWLSTSVALEQAVSRGMYNRSESELQALIEHARLYVEHPQVARARELLKTKRVCVISGAPGVGKTTLANILTLDYLHDDFQVFIVSSGIDEAFQAFKRGSRQLFLFDDFLGRANLGDTFARNEDARLVEFMRLIGRTSGKRFILTTREYLLRRARAQSEALGTADTELVQCVIEVGGYSRIQKARILYNHLYWSPSLGRADVEALIEDRRWQPIIDHPNYNPRLIEMAVRELAQEDPSESG